MKYRHIPELLDTQATRYKNKSFIIFQDKETSYKKLNLQSRKTANILIQQTGFAEQDRLGILLPNGVDFLVSFFGGMYAGGTALPFNILLKSEELLYQIDHSEIKVLVTNAKFLNLIFPVLDRMENLKYILLLGNETEQIKIDSIFIIHFESALRHSSSDLPITFENIKSENVAGMLYTSGTTGRPKGCMLSHENYLSNAEQISSRLNPEETDFNMCIMPLFHVNAQVGSVIYTLYSGSTLVLEEQFKPRTFLPTLKKYRCRTFSAVPTIYNYLNEMPEYKENGDDLSFLRACICGAAPMPVEVFKNFERKFGAKILEGYGLSEGTCASTLNPLAGVRKVGSIGIPLDGQEVRIMDDNGNFLSSGQIGEIIVQGKNVMVGYFKDQRATQETIQDGWLRTGDLGHTDEDGYLFITGRKKEMLIRGGENIYPKEIEETLYQLPAVMDCAVVGFPDEIYGEQVVAVIQTKENFDLDEKTVKKFLKDRLANYKVPGIVIFVAEFPRTASGKIQKLKLRQNLLEERIPSR
ncbi:long-chain fatty acid--CoA ligase [Leptospira kmetyi]|uniref:Long-chain fatty acid--CoA ligase n=1 Tax=Leptospira kmetyi TaxID=408139 RepID=A0AAD0UUQ3_9LEPT|nr:AMP-binding protein [Leptospira kmetyi]AYV56578.1 long-chain fatty acid--CoA ligase [Leptospira kmetyi]